MTSWCHAPLVALKLRRWEFYTPREITHLWIIVFYDMINSKMLESKVQVQWTIWVLITSRNIPESRHSAMHIIWYSSPHKPFAYYVQQRACASAKARHHIADDETYTWPLMMTKKGRVKATYTCIWWCRCCFPADGCTTLFLRSARWMRASCRCVSC